MSPAPLRTQVAVEKNIRMMKRRKAAGPDKPPPRSPFFKSCREALTKTVASLLRDIWNEKNISYRGVNQCLCPSSITAHLVTPSVTVELV